MIPVTLCTVKSRSSHRRCFVGKGVLRNFWTFTVASACNFIKKEALAQVFSCKFCKISRNTFFTEHLWMTASANQVTSYSTYLLNDKNYNMCFLTICFYRPCLARLIYFCQFPDFKFQKNKVQNQKNTSKYSLQLGCIGSRKGTI